MPAKTISAILLIAGLSGLDGKQRLERDDFEYVCAERACKVVEHYHEQAVERLAELEGIIGSKLDRPIMVVAASDGAEFTGLLGEGRLPEWAAGAALPSMNAVLLNPFSPLAMPPFEYVEVFSHELAHLALAKAVGGPIPRWLNEGLAQYLAHESKTRNAFYLVRAHAFGKVIPLEDLIHHWPAAAEEAHLAYAQSYDFTAYLVEKKGVKVVRKLIDELAAGRGVETALRTATGQSLSELQDDWAGRMSWWYAWIPLITGSSFIWAVTTVLFLLAYLRKRREIRDGSERLAFEDARDAAYGADYLQEGDHPLWRYEIVPDEPPPFDEDDELDDDEDDPWYH